MAKALHGSARTTPRLLCRVPSGARKYPRLGRQAQPEPEDACQVARAVPPPKMLRGGRASVVPLRGPVAEEAAHDPRRQWRGVYQRRFDQVRPPRCIPATRGVSCPRQQAQADPGPYHPGTNRPGRAHAPHAQGGDGQILPRRAARQPHRPSPNLRGGGQLRQAPQDATLEDALPGRSARRGQRTLLP